ncbi:ABC transporter permease [Ornithinimicrobium pratense]|uniref:Transport permease protein n=1 Tax=Ornithinimicrobium pratense TaxID=2593973 RepID=A0A5J6V9V0_9MICO|nr:ABC transporter permease [Ornithinimicrobium pratense]QFG69991.1 ABC transporter permease [Ornithinimicrobium pratense]
MSAPTLESLPRTRLSDLGWAAADTWVVARRHLLRLVRRPDELLGTLLIPVMAVLMFGFVFGDALGAAMAVPGGEYRDFLLPGLFALTMAFGIGNTTIAVAADVRGGVLDRMRSLPMSNVALLTGRSLADLVTALVELTILMALGMMLGWQWHGSLAAALAAVGLLLLLRLALSWVGILLGLLVSGPEAAMKYFALIFPLAMVADTIVPTSLMPEWLAGAAEWNPLSATVTAIRGLFGGPNAASTSWVAEHSVAMAVAWPLAITTAGVLLALARLRRLGR